jgi:putative PIG3 family NAD(P)H quinone oxidoreductase
LKAIVVVKPGGPEVMQLEELADLQPQAGELLVRVRAAGVNRADLLQRQGMYPPPPGASKIIGMEIAGEILAVGAGVAQWQPGQRMMALLAGGGYAEQAIVPAAMAMPIPANLSFEQAGAIPEAFLTAHLNLFMPSLGELQAGQKVLVHAGGSGVGSAAIQEAKAAGAQVFVTCSQDKLAACQTLGADLAIDYKSTSFAEQIKQFTQGGGVDIILDFIGGSYLSQNLDILNLYGRLILIGQLGGSKAEIDLGLVMRKRLRVTGTTLRARPLEDKIALTQHFSEFALAKFTTGQLKPVLDRVFTLAEVADAHRYMAENRNFGKIVLKV